MHGWCVNLVACSPVIRPCMCLCDVYVCLRVCCCVCMCVRSCVLVGVACVRLCACMFATV